MQHVSTIYARFICRELNLDTEVIDKLLCGSSLNTKDLFELSIMPYLDFYNFLTRIKSFNIDPTLSLQIGKKLGPMSFGELGNSILSAPNLLESLILGAKFFKIDTSYFEITIKSSTNSIFLIFTELEDLNETRQFQTEVLVLAAQNFIETLVGKKFIDGKYYFPYAIPIIINSYSEYFSSPCYFNSEHAMIEIPQKYATSQSLYHNPAIWRNHQLQLSTKIIKINESKLKPFTKIINDLINSEPPSLCTASKIAAKLNITERTLSRRLKQEGSCFRDIKNLDLLNRAKFFLKETNLTIDAIACQLGYRDSSSFRRAFKEMEQSTPTEYRKKSAIQTLPDKI